MKNIITFVELERMCALVTRGYTYNKNELGNADERILNRPN